tara:strand:- start:1170 stop:2033 length:864 start_codon:yes stop_codon:yes gene_type:complete
MSFLKEEELKNILPINGPSVEEVKKYLNKYKNEYVCIKIGGSILEEKNLFKTLIKDISILKKLNFHPILIHGGGKRLTAKLSELNINSNFISGLRVSDSKIINIIEDVFVKFNKEIVNELKNNSSKARSINSKENNVVYVKTLSKNLGFVGKPDKINTEIIKKIIKANEIPVIAPLGINSKNQVHNVNADEIATATASALNARRLVIISDVPGVLDKNNNLISEINSNKVKEMIKIGEISGGMIPKLNNAINIAHKVKGTVIIDGRVIHSILYELLSDKGSGTLIRK